jgi:hypothetical protein
MRVRNPDGYISANHELVFATGIRPIKAELLEIRDQIPSFDGSKQGHQAQP